MQAQFLRAPRCGSHSDALSGLFNPVALPIGLTSAEKTELPPPGPNNINTVDVITASAGGSREQPKNVGRRRLFLSRGRRYATLAKSKKEDASRCRRRRSPGFLNGPGTRAKFFSGTEMVVFCALLFVDAISAFLRPDRVSSARRGSPIMAAIIGTGLVCRCIVANDFAGGRRFGD